MSLLSAYSYYSSYSSRNDTDTTTIILLVLGAIVSIAILVFFMVYLYRIERNTKDMLWYLKMLTGKQQPRSESPDQENAQFQDELLPTDLESDDTTPETVELMERENKTESHGYVIATLVILGLLLIIAIIMAAINS